MTQLYHDGMAIVRKLGKADLFITFTAVTLNPVTRALLGKVIFSLVAFELILQFT